MYYYQRLRDLREDSDKTQKDIAEYLGIIPGQYQRYESGKREIPYHMVIKLARYYKVSMDYISGLTNDKMGLTKSALSYDETKLIKKYRGLSLENKGRILERIDMLSES